MLAACSASSGTQGGGWNGQSGGGPLGGSTDNESTGPASDASVAPIDEAGGLTFDAGANGASTTDGDAGTGEAASDGPSTGEATTEGGGNAGATPDFTLIDTAITGIIDGSPVTGFDPIAQDATINLGKVSSTLSIRANTVPAVVGSVAFALDATYTHTENTAPYMLCSDDGAGNIVSCASVLTVGKHTLTATPYSAASLGGDAGAPITLDFTIVDVVDAGTDVTDAGGQ
jgi:hypothetical protein